ncbi:minichromosome maintenance domain-containing protein 2-like [Dendronephthya gigantea]|uniref:minichromosome maintenance domain-containing protein 2-like n=1 Tax=Dendronephthya gigantea TaxID=151771 RepID=UPI001068DFF8|nr:minichromosome maintenance domain-containing protein 2-like [Dendronephthya gigantea]
MAKTQIDLQIRCSSIPHFISCSSVFSLKRELQQSGNMSLFSTVGIVSGITSRVNYTRSTWFQCINNRCSSSIGSGCARYSNHLGNQNISGEIICNGCGTPLEEDISCRILGEKCLLRVISYDGLANNILENANSRLKRSIWVYIRDELMNEVELGSCYSFSLIPFREFYGGQNSSQLSLVFEANNVTKVNFYSYFKLKTMIGNVSMDN